MPLGENAIEITPCLSWEAIKSFDIYYLALKTSQTKPCQQSINNAKCEKLMLQCRNLANCHSPTSLFNLKISLLMQCIYKHTIYNRSQDWRKCNCTCLKPYMYLKLKFQVTDLYQTVIEIIDAKFKLEQLETRTQLIN